MCDSAEKHFIYFGQYSGFSVVSRIIRIFTWSNRSHTSAFRPPDDFGMWGNVIEAWKKGVTEQHWTENHRAGTVIDIFKVECTKTQRDAFYRSMEAKKGARYDFLGVLGFGVRMNIESEQRWFCSESVFDSALKAGIELLARIPAHKVSPSMMDLIPTAEYVETLTVP